MALVNLSIVVNTTRVPFERCRLAVTKEVKYACRHGMTISIMYYSSLLQPRQRN